MQMAEYGRINGDYWGITVAGYVENWTEYSGGCSRNNYRSKWIRLLVRYTMVIEFSVGRLIELFALLGEG